MNSLALPVVHPAFQKLKRAGRFLHLAAGGLILVHALSHFNQPHSSPVYLGCLMFMAVDIIILVMAGKNIAADLPLVNLFFRLLLRQSSRAANESPFLLTSNAAHPVK